MIRVLLADDEMMVRAGIRSILSTDPEIEVVAEAGNGREAIQLTQQHRPDIALLDIRMPKLDGLAATAEIGRTAPGTSVIILTTFGEDDYISRALGSGASGFLLKSGSPQELIAGVHGVAQGAACLSPMVARRVITHLSSGQMAGGPAARAKLDPLTSRELEVLTLLATGLSNAEIARRLFLSEGTVKTHVGAILHRLGVRNRVQAAILAYQAGLVDETGRPEGAG